MYHQYSYNKRLLGEAKLLLVDEAQVIPDIGKALKLMIDEIDDLTIIATSPGYGRTVGKLSFLHYLRKFLS